MAGAAATHQPARPVASSFALQPTPPFRLDLTAWALRRRPDNAVDRWDGATWRRALTTGGAPAAVAVHQAGPPEAPRLQVMVEGFGRTPGYADVADALRHVLGAGADLTGFYRIADNDPLLGPLAHRFRGVHPPRLPTVFETLANAVSCQQLSLTVGIILLNRLTERYGRRPEGSDARAFPEPDDLAGAAPDELRRLGYSHRKADVLIRLARHAADGTLAADQLAAADDATVVSQLTRLDGIGRWSAEYVLLRGLGRLHVFPGDDVGARNKLARWLAAPEPLDYAGVRRVVDRWQPYAGLVYFPLLLDSLAAAGWLTEAPDTRR